MSETNPYISLIQESEEKPSKKEEKAAEATPVVQETPEGDAVNPYLGLADDATPSSLAHVSSFDPSEAAWWSSLGGAGAALLGRHPSPEAVAGSRGARAAELISGAPPDILQKIMEQQKRIPGIQAAIESTFPEAATPPVSPESGGAKWSQNWAGVENPIEESVPQASARYNRSKGQGPVTSKLTKKFGPNPQLSIQQYPSAEAAAAEAENAARAELAMQMEAAERARNIEKATQATQRAAKLAPALTVANRVLTGAGLGLGAYDISRRYKEGDKLGAGLSALATGVGTAMPALAPLSAAAMTLYDSPEARQKFLESMKPNGAWQQRMQGRFGLD